MSQDFAVVEWLFYAVEHYRDQVESLSKDIDENNDKVDPVKLAQLRSTNEALNVLSGELNHMLVEGCDSLSAFYQELVEEASSVWQEQYLLEHREKYYDAE